VLATITGVPVVSHYLTGISNDIVDSGGIMVYSGGIIINEVYSGGIIISNSL
jgi:hypothetical protein